MKAVVSEHVRRVPRHYRKEPEVVDINIDDNNCAEVRLRDTRYVIRVNNIPAQRTSVVEDFCANLKELLK